MVVNVAKPIEPTPMLKGEDVVKFYETMQKEEANPDPKRLELITKGIDIYAKITKK
jgi:hypothetical protein